MAYNINAMYGQLMDSELWNHRFKAVFGGNVVLSGFNVTINEYNQITVPPGVCIINGTELESTTDKEFQLTSSQLISNSDLNVVLTYYHTEKRVSMNLISANTPIKDNQLVLALVINDGNGNIKISCPDKALSLSQIINYIKENPGDKIFQTIQERDAYPEEKLYVGFSCFVVEKLMPYYYKGDRVWGSGIGASIAVGEEAPESQDSLWVDVSDENLEEIFEDPEVLQIIKETMSGINKKVEQAYYVIKHDLDAGYFKGIYPGYDENPEEPEEAPTKDHTGPAGTVNNIRIKRGLKENLDTLMDGELGWCSDSQELYIGSNGYLIRLFKTGAGSGGSGSTSNVTAEYIELISPNKKKYRVKVNDDGEIISYDAAADTAEDALIENVGAYKGLIVYQVYGGGNAIGVGSVPVSHSFIELYNNSNNPLNLKGLSVQYAGYQEEWQILPLKGIVRPFTSFLIRCKEHVSPEVQSLRCKIKNYDMSWDIPITEHGRKVYVCVGTEPCEYVNPFDIDGVKTKAPGYIDMMASGGKSEVRMIDGYETTYSHLTDKYTAVYRMDFKDTDNNTKDCRALDYRYIDSSIYGPRCSKDGQWDVYYDKMKMDPLIPNLINMGFGQDGNSSRTFTWQSVPTKKGFLKYKKRGDTDWITVPSKKTLIQHYDTDATSHSVIIRDLEPGIYVYKLGEEGRWSDEAEFEVKHVSNEEPITFLQISDQQGWNEEEYSAWEKANGFIEKNETYDFIVNTGDMTQNANRSYEWRYYYEMARQNLQSHAHMMVCGNNDLIDKKDPTAFTYYATYENSIHPSVYSFNYGYIHFICLNSNIIKKYTEIEPQIQFIREDMAKPENQKRWTIVMMHETPYQIVRTERIEPFINVFAEVGVDLVLGGHHHCYTRSHRMGAMTADGEDVLDPVNGVYYVMCQATGCKLSGKTNPTPSDKAKWRAFYDKPGDPCYIMWEVTYDKIVMKPYRVANIMPLENNIGKEPYKIPFDTGFEITK